jgi:hypothetical protein
MALTVTNTKVYVIGDRKEVIATVTFDSSYANAGSGVHGEALVGSDLGLDIQLDYVSCGPATSADGLHAYVVAWDSTNSKLTVWKSNGTTDLIPVANAVDLSTYTCRVRAVGKGKATV